MIVGIAVETTVDRRTPTPTRAAGTQATRRAAPGRSGGCWGRASADLQDERGDDGAVVLLEARVRGSGLVVVQEGQLQLEALRQRGRQADLDAVERIAEVVHLPERGAALRQAGVRRELHAEA